MLELAAELPSLHWTLPVPFDTLIPVSTEPAAGQFHFYVALECRKNAAIHSKNLAGDIFGIIRREEVGRACNILRGSIAAEHEPAVLHVNFLEPIRFAFMCCCAGDGGHPCVDGSRCNAIYSDPIAPEFSGQGAAMQ